MEKNAAETTINDKTLLVDLIFIVRTISFWEVQGRVEPPDALDRQDLGVASVLSRTDGQGADLAGCGIAEMTILSLARYTLQPSARRVESVYRWMSFCGYCF